jgi:hypothetical protein
MSGVMRVVLGIGLILLVLMIVVLIVKGLHDYTIGGLCGAIGICLSAVAISLSRRSQSKV